MGLLVTSIMGPCVWSKTLMWNCTLSDVLTFLTIFVYGIPMFILYRNMAVSVSNVLRIKNFLKQHWLGMLDVFFEMFPQLCLSFCLFIMCYSSVYREYTLPVLTLFSCLFSHILCQMTVSIMSGFHFPNDEWIWIPIQKTGVVAMLSIVSPSFIGLLLIVYSIMVLFKMICFFHCLVIADMSLSCIANQHFQVESSNPSSFYRKTEKFHESTAESTAECKMNAK